GALRNWGIRASTLAIASAFALLYLVDDRDPSSASSTTGGKGLDWQPFSQARLDALRAEGRPIFVDFTAAWCITCVVNERIALTDPDVVKAFADGKVAALRADWTRRDPAITRILQANGRAGVPLYLFYRKAEPTSERKAPVILPQVLTAASILREVREE